MAEKENTEKKTASLAVDPILKEEYEMAYPHIKTEIKTEQEELLGKCGGYLCPICTKHFFIIDYFVKHVKEHHSQENVPADDTAQCSWDSRLSSVSDKINNTRVLSVSNVCKTDNKHFKCPYCSHAAVSKSGHLIHVRTHTGKESFKCSDCSFVATCKSALQTHSRIHTGEKPFQCSDCSFATATKYNLRAHSRIHTGEKPFKCSDCSFATAKKSHLRTHSRIHTGEKPFKCSDCSFATAKKCNLRRHSGIRHNGKKPFKGSDCSYNATSRKSNLQTYAMIHSDC